MLAKLEQKGYLIDFIHPEVEMLLLKTRRVWACLFVGRLLRPTAEKFLWAVLLWEVPALKLVFNKSHNGNHKFDAKLDNLVLGYFTAVKYKIATLGFKEGLMDENKDIAIDQLSVLRPTTNWVDVEVISEPSVKMTNFGYSPVVKIIESGRKIPRLLIISAKSLAVPLEEMRSDNDGMFNGLKFSVRKASEDKKSPYELK